jgi:hypothetical protein
MKLWLNPGYKFTCCNIHNIDEMGLNFHLHLFIDSSLKLLYSGTAFKL